MNDTNSLAQVKWKGNTISHLHHISESYTGKADVTAPVMSAFKECRQGSDAHFYYAEHLGQQLG